MSPATLHTGPGRPSVRFERRLRQSPESVWRALTDREELKSWFPTDIVTEEWKLGATLKFEFRQNEGPSMTGTVLEFDEPRLLSFSWGDDILRFELTPAPGGGTLLVLIDEVGGQIAARNAAGWGVCLDRMEGKATDENAWQAAFDGYVAVFEPALGPQEGPPAGSHD